MNRQKRISASLKILDTVVLASFIDREHPLHTQSRNYVSLLNSAQTVFVPSVILLELDLVMKNRKFDFDERIKIFESLSKVIPKSRILSLTASIMNLAARLDRTAGWSSHYFDVIVAAYGLEHSADIVTTDGMISSLGPKVVW